MESMRYLPPMEMNGQRQMALDEALLRGFDKGISPPTLRFFQFSPSCITMGYAQNTDEVIHTDICDELGIPYIRRITGGGTVYHDLEGEITYSIVGPKREETVEDSFYRLLKPMIETLRKFDLDAVFKPYNDILVNKRKISGSAQRRGKKGMLQHGTLMYATDLETLSKILVLDEDKLRARGAKSFMDLVTTIEDELGWTPKPEDLIEDLKASYEEHMGIEIEDGKLTKDEIKLVDKFEDRYRSESWTYNRKWEG